MPPKTTKRSVGLVLRRWKCPTMVRWWLIATVTTGMNIITLPTIPTVTSQAGSGPPIRWWVPAQL